MRVLLDGILRRLITLGRLTVVWPDGSRTVYAGDDGPAASILLRDGRAIRGLVLNPALAVGEAYMAGRLDVEDGSIYDALDVLLLNLQCRPDVHPMLNARQWFADVRRKFVPYAAVLRRRRGVARRYHLNQRLYSLFLDRDRQYSCAYFLRGDETLEEAQTAKKRHIAAKLCLNRSGLRVLDIGCGTGGMALTLAREFDAHVTGITTSEEELTQARARAAAEGLEDRVKFELLDYRALGETFDRIVSVASFQHVGAAGYHSYFRTIARCLRSDGVAVMHATGRSDGPAGTNAWLKKYISPSIYSPALSEILPPIEQSGLIVTDIEVLRLHYAETLRHWRRRFAANRDAVQALYDDDFCRMFEFYLAASEATFRRRGHMVWEMQLTNGHGVVPLTREYIDAAETGRPMLQKLEASSPLRR